jgi:hypothetical protein
MTTSETTARLQAITDEMEKHIYDLQSKRIQLSDLKSAANTLDVQIGNHQIALEKLLDEQLKLLESVSIIPSSSARK